MVPDQLLESARRGDLAALVELDSRGLLLAGDEDLDAYVARLECLRCNTADMEQALVENGRFSVEDVTVAGDQRIPAELFAAPGETTRELYAFAADWVPGFFINPAMSLLFGGCAYYFHPDLFALFIVRRAFAVRDRWLIYSRDELLAHELCHVARMGLESEIFEESFAYQTSTSRFRRLAGSIFRTPLDSLGVLAAVLAVLVAQIVRVFAVPSLWIWPFWSLVVAVMAFLTARHIHVMRTVARARRKVAAVMGEAGAMPALFRCTDAEVLELADLSGEDAVRRWIETRETSTLRWRLITARFRPRAAAPDPPVCHAGDTDPGATP